MRKFIFDRSNFLLTVIFIVATGLIFFLMGLTYKHLQKQNESSDWMTQSYEVSNKLERLYSALSDIELERRNFVLARDGKALDIISEKNDEVKELETRINELIDDNPAQLENMDALQMMIKYHSEMVERDLKYRISEGDFTESKTVLLSARNVMAGIHDKIHEMLVTEQELLVKRKDDFFLSQKSTPIYLYIISLFSLGLLIFAFYRINREVKQQKKINQELELSLETSKMAEQVGGYGIWILNYDTGKYVFSDNEYRILGYKPQSFEADYDSFMRHVHPEDREEVNRKSTLMIEGGVMDSFRYRVIRKDGSLRHFQVIGRTLRNQNGEKIMLGITTDVTHEIENQMKLEGINWILTEKNKNLSISYETFSEAEKIGSFGTWQWFIDESRYNFSENLLEMYGIDKDSFIEGPEPLFALTHPEDEKLIDRKRAKLANHDPWISFTYRIYRKNDGVLRYFSVNSKLITDDQNIGNYFLVTVRDVTQEEKDQRTLEEQNRTLAANNQELQAFNYVASHDLQEPLRKIETFISRLHDKEHEKLSDSGKQYMERIQFSAGRMRKLIDDLLQFSRTTRSEQTFEKADLNVLMQESLEELHHQIQEKNAEIKVEKLPVLKVVPFQIQQLFINLIGNSLKYSKADVPPQVSINVELTDAVADQRIPKQDQRKYYKITFQDNGIGFEQQYAEKIFTLFNRLHGKMDFEGTGIGLAICRKIVENHQGYIFAEGEPDVGSVFTVYIPEKPFN